MLQAVLAGVQAQLRDNLVGVYLRGSLVTGDFIPETSDVDVLAVTERRVSAPEFTALADLHAQLAAGPNPYANRIELAYLDRAALRQFQTGLSHPTLGQGDKLAWSEHSTNWIFERWTVRRHGIALLGPPPQTLIDPISTADILAATRVRLRDWAAWAQNLSDPEWQAPRRGAAAYVVETMCRARYTLAHAELASKRRAVAWARAVLPEPWRATVARAQAWRADNTTDPAIVAEVIGFVLWAAAEAPEQR
jgi:hypothetical protein